MIVYLLGMAYSVALPVGAILLVLGVGAGLLRACRWLSSCVRVWRRRWWVRGAHRRARSSMSPPRSRASLRAQLARGGHVLLEKRG